MERGTVIQFGVIAAFNVKVMAALKPQSDGDIAMAFLVFIMRRLWIRLSPLWLCRMSHEGGWIGFHMNNNNNDLLFR